jgi:hypothetical protein
MQERKAMSSLIKIMVLIMLIFLIFPASCQPLGLGNGRSNKVVNLDMGASQPGYRPFMGERGFVAPNIPQIMALSPGAMIFQAKIIRDESASIRDETEALLSSSKDLAIEVRNTADSVEALANQVRTDAQATSNYSSEARDILRETRSTQINALAQAQRFFNLTRRIENLAERIELLANESALHAAMVEIDLNKSQSINNSISLAMQEMRSLNNETRSLLYQAREYANISASNANCAPGRLNGIAILQNETAAPD